MEEWKQIADYPDYEVSNQGNVNSLKYGRKRLNIVKAHTGYSMVCLRHNGKQSNCLLHRLIALAFLPNPENKPTVDHIDRDKSNNILENLRWAYRWEQQANTSSSGVNNKLKELNIQQVPWGFQVRLQRHKVAISKFFKTLEDAVEFRNKIICSTNHT